MTSEQIAELKAVADGMGFGRTHNAIRAVLAENARLTGELSYMTDNVVPALKAEVERLTAALEPVKAIWAPPALTASEGDHFERGCPLSKSQIRKMQEALGITYRQGMIVAKETE